jgi:hypothetical protein
MRIFFEYAELAAAVQSVCFGFGREPSFELDLDFDKIFRFEFLIFNLVLLYYVVIV